MNRLAHATRGQCSSRDRALLDAIAPTLATLRDQATELDAAARFPTGIFDALRAAGLLAAPLFPQHGGLGWGTTPQGTEGLLEALRTLGATSLSVGRVFEAHTNALRLIYLYGTPAQIAAAVQDARDAQLFGLWVADQPDKPVTLQSETLTGGKAFASAAHIASRAVITVQIPGAGECMAILPLRYPIQATPLDLHGVRSASTARLDLTGTPLPASQLLGAPGDYMRQPEISLTAWRNLALLQGTIEALTDQLIHFLQSKSRSTNPHQRARLGQALIAQQTAALWTQTAAHLAETTPSEDSANYVKLARLAVQQSATTLLTLTEQSAGLPMLVRPHPLERLSRDLRTYLRQPAPDAILTEAAAYFSERGA